MPSTVAEIAPLWVVAAVIQRQDRRILLTRRHQRQHLGGLWEFPGGKQEAGETLEQTLHRELEEELAIRPLRYRPLIRVDHHYPEKRVVLDVWRVEAFSGQVEGREGQPLEWVEPERLDHFPLPAADRPIVTACRLPACYLVTPDTSGDDQQWWQQFEQSLTAGIGLVQLRVPAVDEGRLEGVVERAARLCRRHRAGLILNCGHRLERAIEQVGRHQLAGLHLNSRTLNTLSQRPLPAGQWLAASCHSPAELEQAERIGVDFALLSPIATTSSHPTTPPLGWQRLREWSDRSPLPIYALGGMHRSLLETAWHHGAQGIAAISGLWNG